MTPASLSTQQTTDPKFSRQSKVSTSPSVWLCSVGALLVLLLLRSQQLHGAVSVKVAETEAAKAIGDPAVTELAVNIGFYLGVVLSTVLSALYFSLASIAESTLLPRLRRGGPRLRIGLLGGAAAASLLGVQLFSLLLSLASPKDHWATFVYVAVVGACAPLMFRKQWSSFSSKTIAAIFAGSLATAAVSLAL